MSKVESSLWRNNADEETAEEEGEVGATAGAEVAWVGVVLLVRAFGGSELFTDGAETSSMSESNSNS